MSDQQAQTPPGGTTPKGAAPIPSVQVRDQKFGEQDFQGLDPRTLNPNRHYRWVRIDANGRSVTRKKIKGYDVETIRKDGPKTLVDPDKRGDNAIVIGDGVLMSCPKTLHEQRQRTLRKRSEDLLASTSAQTEEEARKKGVRVIKDYEGRP